MIPQNVQRANEIREIIRDYGIDTTILIQISITFDEINFSEVFNGQLGIPDMEEMPNNKIRIPIIRDDRWAKFISRLETPVNIQSITDIDGVMRGKYLSLDKFESILKGTGGFCDCIFG